jgi:hypothetical protein
VEESSRWRGFLHFKARTGVRSPGLIPTAPTKPICFLRLPTALSNKTPLSNNSIHYESRWAALDCTSLLISQSVPVDSRGDPRITVVWLPQRDRWPCTVCDQRIGRAVSKANP